MYRRLKSLPFYQLSGKLVLTIVLPILHTEHLYLPKNIPSDLFRKKFCIKKSNRIRLRPIREMEKKPGLTSFFYMERGSESDIIG